MVVSLILAYFTYKMAEGLGNNIVDYTTRQYVRSLQTYLKRLRLMYERGKIGKKEYEEQEALVRAGIEQYSQYIKQKEGPTLRREFRIL